MINENEILKIKSVFNSKDAVVAFPTDTVWGMGCLPENQKAVEKIYSIKKRSLKKPLILLSSKLEYLEPYVNELNQSERTIIQKYFPGAVTLIVKKSEKTPDFMTSGFETVGIRIPDNEVLNEFFEKCVPGHVLATTSANISDEGSVSTKHEVENNVGKYMDYILDDYGCIAKGLESTVAVVENNNVKVLRQGAVNIIL